MTTTTPTPPVRLFTRLSRCEPQCPEGTTTSTTTAPTTTSTTPYPCEKVWFVKVGSPTVWSLTLEGLTPANEISASGQLRQVRVDILSGLVFWHNGATLYAANIDGTGIRTVTTATALFGSGTTLGQMDVDREAQRVYVATQGRPGGDRIIVIDYNGTYKREVTGIAGSVTLLRVIPEVDHVYIGASNATMYYQHRDGTFPSDRPFPDGGITALDYVSDQFAAGYSLIWFWDDGVGGSLCLSTARFENEVTREHPFDGTMHEICADGTASCFLFLHNVDGANSIRCYDLSTNEMVERVFFDDGAEILSLDVCGAPLVCEPVLPTTTSTTPDPADCTFFYWWDSSTKNVYRSGYLGEDKEVVGYLANPAKHLHVDTSHNTLLVPVVRPFSSDYVAGYNLDDFTYTEVLGSGIDTPVATAVDQIGGFIYWAEDGAAKRVRKANFDGTGASTVLNTGLTHPADMTLDRTHSYLFIADNNTPGNAFILRCATDGTGATQIVTGRTDVSSIDVDPTYGTHGKVYFVERVSAKILRVNGDGTGLETLYTGDYSLNIIPADAVVDVQGGKICWTEPERSRIMRANLDGSGAEELFSTGLFTSPTYLDVCGDTSVAVVTTSTTSTSTSTTCAPQDCGGFYAVATGWLAAFIIGVDCDGMQTTIAGNARASGIYISHEVQKVFWLDARDAGAVYSCDYDGQNVTMLRRIGAASFASNLSFDPETLRLYMIDVSGQRVYHMLYDGTDLQYFQVSTTVPFGLALDAINRKLYVCGSYPTIRRMNLDGTGQETLLDNRTVHAYDIAVDPADNTVFWSDFSTIYRTDLSCRTSIPLITDLTNTYGTTIALDSALNRLLFVDNNYDIMVVNYDGTDMFRLAQRQGEVFHRLACCYCAACEPLSSTSTTGGPSTTPGPTTTTSTTHGPTTPQPTTTQEPPSTTTTTSTTRQPDSVAVPNGRRQIVVDQQQGGTRYPFIDPSDKLAELIGDLYLHYEDDCLFVQPFSIKWLYGFGEDSAVIGVSPVHAYDMAIVDANDDIVFDTTTATSFKAVNWGNTLRVIEWATGDTILRVVKYAAWEEPEPLYAWPVYFEPANAQLDPRTLQAATDVVSTLIFETGDHQGKNAEEHTLTEQGPVVFSGGYNVTFATVEDEVVGGQRRVINIDVDVQANTGLGAFPGCDETLPLRRVNDVAATESGNFSLAADGCPNIVPVLEGEATEPTETEFGTQAVDHGAFTVTDSCGPCCSCQDFLNVYAALKRLWSRYAELARRAEAVRDLMRENNKRWEEQRTCRKAAALRGAVMPIIPNTVAAAAGICNNTDSPLRNVEIKLDFTESDTGEDGCVVCNSSIRRGNFDAKSKLPSGIWQQYKLVGEWPVFYAEFDCINVGDMGSVAFRLDFTGDEGPSEVCMKVSATRGIEPPPAEVKMCVALKKSAEDDECCIPGSSSV